MSAVRIVLGFAVAALFTILIARKVDLNEALVSALRVGPKVLAAAMLLVLMGYLVRAWRWLLMLRGAGVSASYRQTAPIFFSAFALNNVLPLRVGDVYRCLSATKLQDATLAKSLASLLTERVLDLIALAGLLAILLLVVPVSILSALWWPLASGVIVGLAFLIVLVLFPLATWRLIERGFLRLAPNGVIAKVALWIRTLAEAIEGTLSKGSRLKVITLTVAAWLLELGAFVIVGSVLIGTPAIVSGFYAGALGTLATLIPSAPGHFGTFDFFVAEGFETSGLDPENALAAAVVCHIAILVPVTLIGSLQLMTNRAPSANSPGS